MRKLFGLLLLLLVVVACVTSAQAAVPVAASFSATVSTVGSTQIQLVGSDPDGTALTFAIVSGPNPAHGSLSALDAASGYVVFTPVLGYVGVTTFTFNVSSGAQTSATATATITVNNAKTRIIDTLLDPAGSPRTGKVTFTLTQKAQSPGGLIPAASSASATLNALGQFDISVYPSATLSPQAYYQVWYEPTGSIRPERIGVYNIPALTTTTTLAPHAVTNTNLQAQYTFASQAAVNAMISGGTGYGVISVFGRTGSVTAQTGDYTINQLTGYLKQETNGLAISGTSSGPTFRILTGGVSGGANTTSILLTGDPNVAELTASGTGASSGQVTAVRLNSINGGLVQLAQDGTVMWEVDAGNFRPRLADSRSIGSSTKPILYTYHTSTGGQRWFAAGVQQAGLVSPSLNTLRIERGAGGANLGFLEADAIKLTTTTPAAPSLTDVLAGTKLLFTAGPAPDHLAIGVRASALWINVADSNKVEWTFSSVIKHVMTADGMAFGAVGLQPSAILQLDSTDRGFLPPRLTTAQRNAMTVQEGLLIYNTTTHQMNYFNNGTWVAF